MKSIKHILFFSAAILILAACNQVSTKKTPGGMPYKLYKGNGADTVKPGGFIKANIITTLNKSGKDSVVFNSYESLPIYISGSANPAPYDISELFSSLKKGDSLVATQLMDTFLLKSPMLAQQGFKNGDQVIIKLAVVDIIENDSLRIVDEENERKAFAEKEIKIVSSYLADKKINAQKTPQGSFVEILQSGEGALIDSGKYVSVKYTGTSFSGKKFDSNIDTSFHHTDPLSFTVNVTPMIQGFHEAMKLLRKGAKANLYIPSMQGYGGQPQSPDIKPYEHLIFNIEIIDVADKAPAQPGKGAVAPH